jgi:hypothetical protein
MAGSVAALLSLALFAFFSLLGLAVLQLLGSRRNLLRNALLAPSAGSALLVVLLFTFFRLNFPVRRVAIPIAAFLIVGAALVWWRHRPLVPWRRLKPFLIVLGLAFLITGYPLLRYGFNWISYANEDMAGYVVSAHYFVDHGFFDAPNARDLTDNRDVGANYWFFYAIQGARCGSELVVAWLISLTHLTGYQLYMPVMIAFHIGLIAALGALVIRGRRFRTIALTCCAWLGVSSLNTLGTMYQLMPQVFGLMLLIALGAVLLQPFRAVARRSTIRLGLLAGLLLSALTIVYYEILPFLPMAFAGYHGLQLLRKHERLKPMLAPVGIALVLCAACLRTWALSAALFLQFQAGRSLNGQNAESSIFPYYLVPSGLANLWGFAPIGVRVPGLLLNLGILAGGLLLLAASAAAVWQAWKGEPAAILCLIMLLVGLRLFAGNGDFGLFKLAMYIQPFLLASVVLAWFQFSRRWTS